jgi:hypothetical protein
LLVLPDLIKKNSPCPIHDLPVVEPDDPVEVLHVPLLVGDHHDGLALLLVDPNFLGDEEKRIIGVAMMPCTHQRKGIRNCTIIFLLFVIPLFLTAGCVEEGHTGVTFDTWVLKTDKDGHLQWMTTINGDPNRRGEAILQTTGGGYAIAGTGTGPVPRVLTLDADGKVLTDTSLAHHRTTAVRSPRRKTGDMSFPAMRCISFG